MYSDATLEEFFWTTTRKGFDVQNNHGCWFSDPFHLNLRQLPGLPWSLLWCLAVRPCYVYCFGFLFDPHGQKTHQGLKSPFEAPGIYFATTTHYHYHPLLLPISIFLIGYMYIYIYIHIYIYIYICECRKGCVFLDLEIDPRVDKSWDRGFVSLPFLLGTSPSHPLPTL